MTTLDELRERLEKAEGLEEIRGSELWDWLDLIAPDEWQSAERSWFVMAWKEYDAPLSAAIALVEAKLPTGYRRSASMRTANGWMYFIKGDGNDSFEGWHKSEPIALLLALLSALEKESAE